MNIHQPTPGPGLPNQSGTRTAFRVLGISAVVVALAMLLAAGIDFFQAFNGAGQPSRFWMFFVALPLLGVGGWLLQAGFIGVGARYASGELAPVAKDTAAYLTDGRGLFGVGASAPGRAGADTGAPPAEGATGPYCRSCGTRNDTDAAFCDSCGSSLV
jgi:hypothetical protein